MSYCDADDSPLEPRRTRCCNSSITQSAICSGSLIALVTLLRLRENKMVAIPTSLGKRLADTDEVERNKALNKLYQWMGKHAQNIESEFEWCKLWRVMWYALWMSDKRAKQHEIAVNMIKSSTKLNEAQLIVWTEAFFKTVKECWMKLDKYRTDRYLLLVRIFVAEVIHRIHLSSTDCSDFSSKIISLIVAGCDDCIPVGLHILRVLWEEFNQEFPSSDASIDPSVLKAIIELPRKLQTCATSEILSSKAEECLSNAPTCFSDYYIIKTSE